MTEETIKQAFKDVHKALHAYVPPTYEQMQERLVMNFGWNWKDSKEWIVDAAKEGKALYADKSQFESSKERQYAVRSYVNKKIDDMFDTRGKTNAAGNKKKAKVEKEEESYISTVLSVSEVKQSMFALRGLEPEDDEDLTFHQSKTMLIVELRYNLREAVKYIVERDRHKVDQNKPI